MQKILLFSTVLMVLFSGPAFGDFVDNGDRTVTDTSTCLMWQQGTTEHLNWEEAISFCENLTLGEYEDWRLPSRNELQSLMDYTKH